MLVDLPLGQKNQPDGNPGLRKHPLLALDQTGMGSKPVEKKGPSLGQIQCNRRKCRLGKQLGGDGEIGR